MLQKLPLASRGRSGYSVRYTFFTYGSSLVIVSISWSRPPPALVKFARSLLRMSTLPYGFKRRQSIRLGTRRLAPSRRGDSQRSKANHRRRLISALGNIATSKALSLVGYQV